MFDKESYYLAYETVLKKRIAVKIRGFRWTKTMAIFTIFIWEDSLVLFSRHRGHVICLMLGYIMPGL